MLTRFPGARSWRLVWLLIAALLWPASAVAADGTTWQDFNQPRFTRMTTADGLPHNGVSAIVQDARGFLWFGTSGGLVRYDGQRLYSVLPGPASGLTDGYVRTMLALPEGRILIGTNRGGLLLFDPLRDSFAAIPLGREQRVSAKIFSLRVARDGGVWVASSFGLDHFDPATGRAAPVPLAGFPDGHSTRIFDVAEDAEGRLWLGANPGLFVREPGASTFAQVHGADGRTDGVVWRLYLDRDGLLWIGTDHRGAFALRRDGRFLMPPALAVSGGLIGGTTVRDFLEDRNGNLWIATYGDGVVVCRTHDCSEPRMIHSSAKDSGSLASNLVRGLFEDHAGNVWAAAVGGVSRTAPLRRRAFLVNAWGPGHGLLGASITAVMVDRQRRVWLGLQGQGVRVLDLRTGQVQALRYSDRPGARNVVSIVQTDDGTVWIGGLGVVGVDPTRLRPVATIPALADARVTTMNADGDALLISTYNGTFRYRQPELARVRVTGSSGFGGHGDGGRVQVADSLRIAGRRWYATSHGLAVAAAAGESVHMVGDHAEQEKTGYASMLAWDARRHRLWVASERGLWWLNPEGGSESWRLQQMPLVGRLRQLTSVVLDGKGGVWASTARDIMHVGGGSETVHLLNLGQALSLLSFNYGVATAGPDESVLFGSSVGLVVVRSQWPDAARHRAPLVVSRLVLDDHEVPLARVAGGDIQLEAGQRNLSMDFALLDFNAQQAIRYSYRLRGFDAGWRHIDDGMAARLAYTNLPAGDFALALRAQVHGLDPYTAETSIFVRVAPYWYETWWARLLLGVLLILAALILVCVGLRWSRNRQRLLDELIKRRTRELRDANATLERLASIDALTGLLNRRAFMEQAEKAFADAVRHQRPLVAVLVDLDHFKKVNDSRGHLAGDAVLSACGALFRETCRIGDILGRYGGEEIVLVLPDTGIDAAHALAERLRTRVGAMRVDHRRQVVAITCSIGVAARRRGDASLAGLLSRADAALYAAKDKGRDRVELAPDLLSAPSLTP